MRAVMAKTKPMTTNPYVSPEKSPQCSSQLSTHSRRRWIALALVSAPFVLAIPLRYWAFNHAGGWFVSTDLEPDHRRAFLGLMCSGLILSIGILCFFGASVLLWLDRFYPAFSGGMAIVFGLLAIPTGLFLVIGINSYLKFG